MLDKSHNLLLKHISGEDLTDGEKKYLKERHFRYELVKYLYLEKRRHMYEGAEKLVGFDFTPGDDFMDTPIMDTVNALVKLHEDTMCGAIKPTRIRFGDIKSNPPRAV